MNMLLARSLTLLFLALNVSANADTWKQLFPNGTLPAAAQNSSSVWTGSEMIIWGGIYFREGAITFSDTGGHYNPILFPSNAIPGPLMDDLTLFLNRLSGEHQVTAGQLLPLVYEDLRRVAAQKMAKETPGQTLQATALVHVAWIRVGGEGQSWDNRTHFFVAAAEAMRRILIDRARQKQAVRHGGGQQRIDIGEVEIAAPLPDDELLAVHEALDRFALDHEVKAELVKLRYFAGLTIKEAAGVLGISEPTAKRYWAYARAWLFREIGRQRDPAAELPAPFPSGSTAADSKPTLEIKP